MSDRKFRILIVDDDIAIRQMLILGLKQAYETRWAANGEEALEYVVSFDPHVIILDVMMPVMSGYEFLKVAKKISSASIIMLTAKDSPQDIVRGLRRGSSDYLVKPFHFDELLARIEVQIRQRFPDLTGIQHIGPFVLDDLIKIISYHDEDLTLSPTEYRLLAYFLCHANQTLSKRRIMEHVWGHDFQVHENILEVYIRYLRDKLNDTDHTLLSNQRGQGYRLIIDA